MHMDKTSRQALADNVKTLRVLRGLSQHELGKLAGIGQTTVSAIENAEGKSIGIDIIEAVATGLQTDTWKLIIPDLPPEVLANRSLEKLVSTYAAVTPEGRQAINHVSENEARYTNFRKTINS